MAFLRTGSRGGMEPLYFHSRVGKLCTEIRADPKRRKHFSYACKDCGCVEVPRGCVTVEGYLKMKGSTVVRRGTLRRRLQHPDLSSITWTACLVGRRGRYTDHDFIQTFHRETALPPAGVLQRSADAVGLRLRVDYLGPSDAPLNKGGWAARKERLPAADSDASGAGAPAGAPPAAPAPSPAAAAGAGGAAPADAGDEPPRRPESTGRPFLPPFRLTLRSQ